MWVSWFSDQIIQVRVLASSLPHSVKETRAFNAFQKDYLFLIPLKKLEHLPSIRLSKMERIGHWINMSKMERIGYWIKSCLIFCSFLCLVIVFLPGYALSGNTIPAWLCSQRQYDRPDRKDWMRKRVLLTVWEFRWQRIFSSLLSVCHLLTTLFCLVWHFWRPRVCVTLLMT